MNWVLIQIGGDDTGVAVFRSQGALRKYLKFNDWKSGAIDAVVDGNEWNDGEISYYVRAMKTGEFEYIP